MSHKLMRSILVAVVMVSVVATMAMAVETKASGTVWNYNDEDSSVVLRTTDGKKLSFSVSGSQMTGIGPGDSVEIIAEHGAVKSLQKTPTKTQ